MVTATDGIVSTSETFQVTSTDTPPTLAAISNVTAAPGNPIQVTLNATAPSGQPITFSGRVTGFNLPFSLMQQFQFQGIGYQTAGVTAYVLHTNQPAAGVNGYYLIRSDGALFAYDGSASYATTFANGTPIAQLGAATFFNPSLLLNAAQPTTPGVGLSFNGNVLTLTLLAPFVGTFQVTVNASDGMLSASQSFQVTIT